MEISPQRVRSAEFKTVRKGADPDEVRLFLNDVADELERSQNQSTAMEARARAAVARLQEMTDSGALSPPTGVDASVAEAETISRTMLLAQRTADTTVAEARGEAARIIKAANDEAATTLDSTRDMAAQLIQEARAEARQSGESERLAIAGEVDALKARRDFLESDVEQLELFLTDQRNRLREAATSLLDITERVPGGLGQVRAPLLSASASDDTASDDASLDDAGSDDLSFDDVSSGETSEPEPDADAAAGDAATEDSCAADDLLIVADVADASRGQDAPTQAMPVIDAAREGDDSGFRFSFDDDRR